MLYEVITGVPWAPLAESTKLRYKAKDKGRRRGTLLERIRLIVITSYSIHYTKLYDQ